MKPKQTETPVLFFADTLAVLFGKSTDAILLWRKKLNVGTKHGTVWIFTKEEAKKIEVAITSAKRGWPAGRKRSGQGSGRRWTKAQRRKFAATIRQRKLDAKAEADV